MAEEIPIPTIGTLTSRIALSAVLGAIVVLIPLLNTAFGLNILVPDDDQQKAIITLVEYLVALSLFAYIYYRRTNVPSIPTEKQAKVMEDKGYKLVKTS